MGSKRTENWQGRGSLDACICSQLRRTTRKVTAIYDKALTPSGLTVSQYSLLVNIARLSKVSLGALAERVGMDRTSLTRSLKPLEAAALIETAASADRRQRLLRVSAEGLRRVRVGYALWQSAQKEISSQLGKKPLALLRESLRKAEEVCGD